MIPFEKQPSLNQTEKRVEELLNSQWSYVIRSTPGIKEDLEGRFPELSETVSRNIMEDTESKFSDVFCPGVPDFLAFSDTGDYLFVEAKSDNDNLRHTQLRWLRDFKGLNMEIWFAEYEKDIEKLEEGDLVAYGFQDVDSASKIEVEEDNSGNLSIEITRELAAITGLDEGERADWRLKNEDELILDTS